MPIRSGFSVASLSLHLRCFGKRDVLHMKIPPGQYAALQPQVRHGKSL